MQISTETELCNCEFLIQIKMKKLLLLFDFIFWEIEKYQKSLFGRLHALGYHTQVCWIFQIYMRTIIYFLGREALSSPLVIQHFITNSISRIEFQFACFGFALFASVILISGKTTSINWGISWMNFSSEIERGFSVLFFFLKI